MGVNRHSVTLQRTTKLATVLFLAAAEAFAEDKREPRRIVVSIPDHKLVLLEGDSVLRVFDVAVGKPASPTPEGQFRVVTRLVNPTWYYAGRIVGPGKSNPLGTRWIGLSVDGYGIHGTNVPASIGKHASHGCVRMRNRDVEELFELVSVGVTVELLGSPDESLRKTLAIAD